MSPVRTIFLILASTCNSVHYGHAFQIRKHGVACSPYRQNGSDAPSTQPHQFYMTPAGDDEFWQQQRALVNEMTDRSEKSLRKEQLKKFGDVQGKLIVETVFVSALIFSLLWLACDNVFVPISYVFGATFGLAYTYGLGKYVETLGGTVEDASAVQGAGVGQARFAFLILLFILVGKLRAYGLIEVPSILGFFTYQISSLFQGLREDY
jgi:hypothetical protein